MFLVERKIDEMKSILVNLQERKKPNLGTRKLSWKWQVTTKEVWKDTETENESGCSYAL